MKEIWIAEVYWEDHINEESVRIPLKAFGTLNQSEDYCDKCSEEKQRIQKELKEYWDIHKAEYDKLQTKIRKILINKENMVDSNAHKRQCELTDESIKIEKSHKHHPTLPIYQDMDLTYESTPLEYEE